MAATHTRQPRRMSGRQMGPSLCSCGDPWPCKVATGEQRLADLRQQVQQARKDYYDQAIDHGELTGHEEQEARAFGRVEACDEILGWLTGTGEEK